MSLFSCLYHPLRPVMPVAAVCIWTFAGPVFADDLPAPEARTPGLQLHVYEVEPIIRLHSLVEGQTPNISKVVLQPDLKTDEDFGLGDGFKDNFLAELTGWLSIEKDGKYEFSLDSDDGSDFQLNGKTVIDHDGLHSAGKPETASIELKAGTHPLRIRMFDKSVTQQVTLAWKPPGTEEFTTVPSTAVFTTANVVQVTSPGPKRLKSPSNSLPGDGRPLTDLHPSFTLTKLHRDVSGPDRFVPRIGGIDFFPDGRMVICAWDPGGEVYIIDNPAGDPAKMKVRHFASGLAEPLGIKVVDNQIYVLQFHELTRLIDADNDGVAERYENVCNTWKATSNFHEFAFGLVYRDGWFYANLAVPIKPGGANVVPTLADRGSVIRIDPKTGKHEIFAAGVRTPNGIGQLSDGSIWLTDNQGDWLPSSTLTRLEEGAFYGVHKEPDHPWADRPVTPVVAWLPQGEIGNSPSQPTDLRVGPWKGQVIHGDVTHGGIKRTFVDRIDVDGKEVLNGSVFEFAQGFSGGVNRLAWGPDNQLYVGQIGSTGNWGQANKKKFGLERLTFNDKPCFEALSIRARVNGLEVEMTEPLAAGAGADPTKYRVKQWMYKRTKSYGGPKIDEKTLAVQSATVSADRKRIFLEVPGLLEGRVVYLRLPSTLQSEGGRQLWSTGSWTTINALHKMPGVPAMAAPDADIMPDKTPGEPAAATTAPTTGPAHNTLTPEETKAGWKLLFDGQSTAGWRGFKRKEVPAGWKAIDGELTRTGGGGDLVTEATFADFELSLEWKIAPGGNSGIFYRVAEGPGAIWESAVEMQVLDNARHADGKSPKTSAGACYALYPPTRDATLGPDRWNAVRILANGTQVEHWMNGELVVTYDTASPEWAKKVAASKFKNPKFGTIPEGRIGLQDHGDRVAYRNIKILELKP